MELKKKRDRSERIVRHSEPYITLEGDAPALFYRSYCWDTAEQIVQLNRREDTGKFECLHYHMKGIYDKRKHQGSLAM